jgi:hypothetical protein
MINPIMKTVDRRRARKAAANPDTLRFRPDEMRQPLGRIASGAGSAADFEMLSAMLKVSAQNVDRSIEKLRRYQMEVREKFGMKIGMAFDDIIFDKIQIRQRLRDLTADEEYVKPAGDSASEISKIIDKLNDDLIAIHDMILPPSAAPKAPARRKRQ